MATQLVDIEEAREASACLSKQKAMQTPSEFCHQIEDQSGVIMRSPK